MATVLLLRHGRTDANATGLLAGRAPGVHLDDLGRQQAQDVGERLADVRLVAALTSPLERCQETTRLALAQQQAAPPVTVEPRLQECDYGTWQGQLLKDLASHDLWKVVQSQPSAVTFPEGESMRELQNRAVGAVRLKDQEVTSAHGQGAVWLAVSHGDVIKAILADALGTPLDLFQRIHVDPASVSVIRYGTSRPTVLGMNTHSGDLSWVMPTVDEEGEKGSSADDAAVGGGAGPGQVATGRQAASGRGLG